MGGAKRDCVFDAWLVGMEGGFAVACVVFGIWVSISLSSPSVCVIIVLVKTLFSLFLHGDWRCGQVLHMVWIWVHYGEAWLGILILQCIPRKGKKEKKEKKGGSFLVTSMFRMGKKLRPEWCASVTHHRHLLFSTDLMEVATLQEQGSVLLKIIS